MTPKGLEVYDYYPLYAGNWQGNKYVVNYRQLGDKWYFSDALREGIYGGGGIYTNEIKITEVKTGKAEPIEYLDRMSRGVEFTRMTGVYDEDFWKAYNVVPLSEGLAESVQQFKNSQKAQEVFDDEYMASLKQTRDSIQRIKTLEAKAELGRGRDLEFDIGEPGFRKKKRDFKRVKFSLGLGSHFIDTEQEDIGLVYLTDDADNPQTIISVQNQIPSRDFEIFGYWNFDIFFHKNYFIRFGTAFDFYNSIYKDKFIGMGLQMNLSKQRPFYLKAAATYSHLQYARKVGQAQNDYGKFKANGKNFKADHINMYYGTRQHNLGLSGEISLELNPGRELYIRGTYLLPVFERQEIWLWERKEIFRKKKQIPVKSDQVLVNRNGKHPFIPGQTISVTVGVVFK
jgi:hypothetical protein